MPERNGHIELFLYRLFSELRRELQYKLGPPEYFLLFRALEKGYGIGTRQDLLRLCEMLWLKQSGDRSRFQSCFERSLSNTLPAPPEPVMPPDLDKSISPPPDPDAGKPKNRPGEPGPGKPNDGQATQTGTTAVEQIEAGSLALTLDKGGMMLEPDWMEKPEGREKRRFYFSNDYLPFSKRDLEYFWRFLKVYIKHGLSGEIDLNATVEHIAQSGHFISPCFKPKRQNLHEVSILVDHEGSMASFETLTEQFVHSALSSFESVKVYYFYNCPERWLYRNRLHTDAIGIHPFLDALSAQKTVLLILSDAGAVRNSSNYNRLNRTKDLIHRIRAKTLGAAWLNPMPSNRWAGNIAEHIAAEIPMFELNRDGLDKAVRALKYK